MPTKSVGESLLSLESIYYNDLVNVFSDFAYHISNKRLGIEARDGSHNFGSVLWARLK